MKVAGKIVGLTVVLAVSVIVSAVAVLCLLSDRALKIGIETAATKTLNVGVSIEDLDLSVLSGEVKIKNLMINNPAGYQYDRLLELGKATVSADVGSLLTDVVNIKEIVLADLRLTIEQKGLTNNLQTVIGSLSGKNGTKKTAKKEGKKLHIDNLEINNVKVRVKLTPIPGKVDTVELDLAPIKMTDLGRDEEIDTGLLSSRIMVAIAAGVAESGKGVLPEKLISSISTELERLGNLPEAVIEKGKKVLESGTELGKEVIESGKDIGKGIKKGFEDLVKPKKQEK